MIRPGRSPRSIAIFGICWAVALALILSVPAWALGLAGRSLAEALNGLHGPGFAIIFSSELVPDALTVRAEPQPGPPADLAQQLLQPFGLGLKNVAPGLFAVVRLDLAGAAAAPPARAPMAAGVLEQVTIAASRYTLASEEGAQTMGSGDIAEQPKYADDPLRVAARLPGITSNGESARLNVRGGNSDEVLFLVDGFPVLQPFHVPGQQAPFSSFDASLISTIDAYTGGFPLRYGERMSGVVDLSTLEPDDQFHSSLLSEALPPPGPSSFRPSHRPRASGSRPA